MALLNYRRHRFPPEIIQHAIWLYLQFTLSYRDVEELLAERGLDISYETVRRWVLTFGPAIARRLRQRLLALWNALPGVEKLKKVGDRDALIDQLWSAIEMLPDPEPQPDPKRPSKQDVVIAMLRQPEGVTVDEVASVTGWQRHTVRGVFSGTLKKKLGLTLASAKEERGRVYRIAEPASL